MIEEVLETTVSEPVNERVIEQIGDVNHTFRFRFTSSIQFGNTDLDITKADYAFWDRARRGQARGLELSGLFIKPMGSKITAWTLGRRPIWKTENETVTKDLNAWWELAHPDIVRGYNEAIDLGDAYLVLNGDLSVTVIPPNMVKPIVADKDNGRRIGWKITMTIPHPDEAAKDQTIEDRFTVTERTRTVYDMNLRIVKQEVFPNLIGRIPVIHIANRQGADELYGRPEAERILNAMIRYGDVFDTALKGNIRQGRPTPVINKMGSPQQVLAFWTQFGSTETHTNPDGTTYSITTIPFDSDELLTLGGEAEFKYEAPGSFSEDTATLLELLFYLILQNSEIPEFVWGNAIGSSKASAESQLEPFLKWIIKRRGDAMAWIQELTDLVLAYMAVYERRARGVKATAFWRPIASADGRLTLDTTIFAWTKGLISDEYALWLMPIGIENPEMVLAEAKTKNSALKNTAAVAKATASAQPAATATGATPASGGEGDQSDFAKQTDPKLPTEFNLNDTEPVTELYELPVEDILNFNRERATNAIVLS